MNPILTQILTVVVALGLLNVWLLRFNKSTAYRGGEAKSLKEEFAVYGLPTWFYYLIGVLKVGSALALLLSFWIPALALPAAIVVVMLMLGALSMHVKVKDPVMKSVPAAMMLIMAGMISLSLIGA